MVNRSDVGWVFDGTNVFRGVQGAMGTLSRCSLTGSGRECRSLAECKGHAGYTETGRGRTGGILCVVFPRRLVAAVIGQYRIEVTGSARGNAAEKEEHIRQEQNNNYIIT